VEQNSPDRIEALREGIATSGYQVDAQAVAAALVQRLIALRAPVVTRSASAGGVDSGDVLEAG
jgi:hypothetical protein